MVHLITRVKRVYQKLRSFNHMDDAFRTCWLTEKQHSM